ncbi:Gfo/Idh/MocA family protein [Plantactinospora sp. BB1]|uniref:Gfo/Idh/MocA family protein n=1 Tax=Plantactinospora sp. BB1 TaxID=2071627 RepID=UPI000D1600D2|nr:Gfo/Idh/MocA family oxidoreductase [Plantactinospora sp. BB1]AVT35939.1 gfo/Idh/MocA family oxidoreductase [Plantactinospora sp. BB1]
MTTRRTGAGAEPGASLPPIPVAIVGGGVIGRNHAAAILRHPRLRVGCVVDPAPPAGRALAERVAAESGAEPPARYESLTDALAKQEIGLVVVCTPSGTHAGLTEEALGAGRHVVIEKPLDVSLPRARRLARLAAEAETRGLVCSVISQHRFDPASLAVHRAVTAGRLGRITSAVASVAWWRSQRYYDSADWRGSWALDGGGALMNQAVHTVDLLRWLLGPPTEVFGYTSRLAHQRIEVEDVAVATVRFASGALAVLHASTGAYPGLSARLQIHGTRGSAVLDDDQLEYLHAADGTGPDGSSGPDEPAEPGNQAAGVLPAAELRGAAKPPDSFVLGHLRQYADIVAAIDAGRLPSIRVEDGFAALALVRAVYLAATLGRPISVDEVARGAFDDVPVTTGPVGGPAGSALASSVVQPAGAPAQRPGWSAESMGEQREWESRR